MGIKGCIKHKCQWLIENECKTKSGYCENIKHMEEWKMEYTKGTWEVGYSDDIPVVTCEARDICTVENYYHDGDANARLIAAAPDMYEALKYAISVLESIPENIKNAIEDGLDESIEMEMLYKAVSKADGVPY